MAKHLVARRDRPRRGLLPILAMLGLSVGGPAVAEEKYRPDGAMFPVADTQLHIVCTGQGAASVVLEAGLGADYLDWARVQPVLAAHLRVCSYDRAGTGWSARTHRPRTAGNITDELHDLVRAAGVERPFILVGHSFGGMMALHYARRYPADVAGLVLLDPMHPAQFDRFAASGIVLDTDPHLVLGRTPAFAAAYGLPDDLRGLAIYLASADKARASVVQELSLMVDDAHEVAEAGYPRLPARIIVHGNREWDRAYPDGRMEQVWTELQGELAVALGAPPPIIAASSGHQIALDAPDIVVATVLALEAAIQR